MLCCSAVLLAAGTASAITVEDLLQRMEEADRTVTAATFDFRQDIIYNLTKERQKNNGSVAFKKPNSLSVNQKTPLEQTIVTNGKKVWIYTPGYKQVLIDSWKKWTSSSMVPASLLNFGQNWGELRENYTFTYLGDENGEYLLLLAPKKKDRWQMKLWIEQKRFIPVRASLEGENITIETVIENYRINPPLDDALFNFQPPKDVEVLKMP
jgi:outer membrane lipoprotein carrier protein